MASFIIQRSSETPKNYFGYVLNSQQNVSWITQRVSGAIDPGTHSIPEDQRNNLQWFYDNGFDIDAFGRRHILRMMIELTPDSVILI